MASRQIILKLAQQVVLTMVNIKSYLTLNTQLKNQLNELNLNILGSDIQDKLTSLSEKDSILALIAYATDGTPLGFKIGFAEPENPTSFYSWAGGVTSCARGQGIASLLMEAQHKKLKELGFKQVTTKCREDRKAMIELNKKFGFVLKETYQSQSSPKYKKHLFCKELT